MRENPFESIDDAVRANYSIPLDISIGLNAHISSDALIVN